MKTLLGFRTLQLLTSILFMFVMTVNLSANAASKAPQWVFKAKQLFEDDEYSRCIDLVEVYKKNHMATMLLAYSHLQENVFNGSKYDKEKFKAYNRKLEAKLGIDDLDDILYFISLGDKPVVVKTARKLAAKVFKKISDIEEIPKLVSFLKSKDEKSRKLAAEAIFKILKPKRKYVSKGGTLRAKDIRVMQSELLISALLEQIELSKAKKSLLLIEKPVLRYISNSDSLEAGKLEVKITKLISKRQKKYPESNWHSAVGKK